ncbi:hypothetical protein [Hydrogenophaga sp. PML113]|uniref:hypothetical protein n=1 Tax=Hydrogenophaga sp. PML113 TaxID=1899350 RepID=UPI00111321B4|nr:hypothetical protein [Hydrogenophaga sp. PML113]
MAKPNAQEPWDLDRLQVGCILNVGATRNIAVDPQFTRFVADMKSAHSMARMLVVQNCLAVERSETEVDPMKKACAEVRQSMAEIEAWVVVERARNVSRRP